MAIHFISGKPGGGKSLYGVKLIVEELVLGKRAIFTNVPIDVGKLNAYLQAKYGDRGVIDIFRLRILTDEETGEFWTHRPGGVRIDRLSKERWAHGEMPSYSAVNDSGVMYVIDEVHNYFGARQWAETGRDVLFYLSQHRKLGDTVVCITQAIGNVDKQFRSVTQDFTFLRNLAKETYGKFKLPGVFIRKTFSSPPTDTTAPMETGTFRLDVSGLAACYDSAQGVGIHGRSADKLEVSKGVHWAWAFVFVGLAVCALFFVVPKAVANFFTTPLRSATRSVVPGVRQVEEAQRVTASRLPVEPKPVQIVPRPASGTNLHIQVGQRNLFDGATNEVFVTSFVVWGDRVLVGLSDGRVFRWPGDRSLEFVGEHYVVVCGQAYRRR